MAEERDIGTNWTFDAAKPSYTFVQEAVVPVAPVAPRSSRNPRQIFVAYPYRLYPKADYRKVYKEVGKAFDVQFVYADEKITNLHILEKIVEYIRTSRFGIYDISGWNANVSLELGYAFGMNERAYIAFDPTKTPVEEVPADLRGYDRIEYTSYDELGRGIERLLAQEIPIQQTHEAEEQLRRLREQAVRVIADGDGLSMSSIAKTLGIGTDLAKVVVYPLVQDGALRTTGQKKGTKYYLA